MSLKLRKLRDESTKKNLSREEILALAPEKKYDDGRTKQCHKDECDINKIMARFDKTGTISHLSKFEGVYADFSDFDFHHHSTMLARGDAIFAALPAEIRREFGQNPAEFFNYVNDPKNAGKLREKLPGLAAPGDQLPQTALPDADTEAAVAAAEELATPIPPKAETPTA